MVVGGGVRGVDGIVLGYVCDCRAIVSGPLFSYLSIYRSTYFTFGSWWRIGWNRRGWFDWFDW